MVIACAGQQVSLHDRGLPSTKAFKGTLTFAGRHQGIECSLSIAGTAREKVKAAQAIDNANAAFMSIKCKHCKAVPWAPAGG